MATPTSIATYNFKPMKFGTQFSGWATTIIFDIDGTDTDVISDIADVKIDIRKTYDDTRIGKQLTLGNGISLNTTVTPNLLVIDAGFDIDLEPFKYVFDIAIDFTTYGKKNFLEGIFPVVKASSVL